MKRMMQYNLHNQNRKVKIPTHIERDGENAYTNRKRMLKIPTQIQKQDVENTYTNRTGCRNYCTYRNKNRRLKLPTQTGTVL
jgi:hypothetical protein